MSVRTRISKAYSNMTDAQRKIADNLVNNLDLVAYGTVKEVAAQVGKSEATVVRFAYFLGYSGYKELQNDIQKQMQKEYCIAQRYMADSSEQENTIQNEMLERAIHNLQQSNAMVVETELAAVAKLLCDSRRVGIVSYRLASSAAVLLEGRLQQVLEDVRLLSPGTGNAFDVIKSWNEQDLIVGFAFTLSQKDSFVYNMAQYAKEKKCKIVLITDKRNSDTATFSDIVLNVSAEGKVLSMVPSIHLIEVLSQMVYALKEDSVSESLKEVEEVFKRFGLSRDCSDEQATFHKGKVRDSGAAKRGAQKDAD